MNEDMKEVQMQDTTVRKPTLGERMPEVADAMKRIRAGGLMPSERVELARVLVQYAATTLACAAAGDLAVSWTLASALSSSAQALVIALTAGLFGAVALQAYHVMRTAHAALMTREWIERGIVERAIERRERSAQWHRRLDMLEGKRRSQVVAGIEIAELTLPDLAAEYDKAVAENRGQDAKDLWAAMDQQRAADRKAAFDACEAKRKASADDTKDPVH